MTAMNAHQDQPSRPRRNTLEKMLELERRNKMKRNQASDHSVPSLPSSSRTNIIDQDRSSFVDPDDHPALPSQNIGRAMTAPNLAISVPMMQQELNGSTKYIISAQGDVVPQEEEQQDDGHDSDVSSICHSPGWGDISGKKRKKEKKEKEKRRREKEKMEVTKLHKAPPRKRLSKTPADRTTSAPAVPTVASTATKYPPVVAVNVPFDADKPDPSEGKKKTGERSRRGSIELTFRNFLGGKKAITTPVKSAQSTPGSPVDQIHTTPAPMPSTANTGFIGGLKLRQSQEADTQEVINKLKFALDNDGKGILDDERDFAHQDGRNSSNTSFADSTAAAPSIYTESVRTPSQWDSIYSQAALLATAPDERVVDNRVPDDQTPIMDRNIRKGRRSHPPTSRYFEETPRSGRDQSSASQRSSVQSDGSNGNGPDSALGSPTAAGMSTGMTTPADHKEEAVRSRASSYAQQSRQHSEEQLVSDASYAVASAPPTAARKSESRGRSIFNRSRSRVRDTSDVRPGSSNGRERAINTVFLNSEDSNSQLHLGQTTHSPIESPNTKHSRKPSFASNFRSAARNAFSKNTGSSYTSGSDTPYQSSAEILTAIPYNAHPRQRATTADNVKPLASTIEPAREDVLLPPPVVHDFGATPRPASRKQSSQRIKQESDTPGGSSSSSQKTPSRVRAYSRSSSEEYSTPDEYSNFPTPTMARSESDKGYFENREGFNGHVSTGSFEHSKAEHMMTGAIPVSEGAGSGREDWSRTALPMEMTDSEERRKTPTPQAPPMPKTVDGLNRQPSLSRSVSTPELQSSPQPTPEVQDLSFLPALKHQALVPRVKEKTKVKKTTKPKAEKVVPKVPTQTHALHHALPPLSPPPTTKSEGSSPTSPESSQYLQNARLALPRPANKPPGTIPGARPFMQTVGGPGPEPIAKMFVICCSCKYFHDMPSKIYECMAKPDNIVRDTELGVSGVVSTAVKCPWCGHGMSTKCCAGYAGVVYLREKFH